MHQCMDDVKCVFAPWSIKLDGQPWGERVPRREGGGTLYEARYIFRSERTGSSWMGIGGLCRSLDGLFGVDGLAELKTNSRGA